LLGAAEALREWIGTSTVGVHRLTNEYDTAVAWLRTQFNETAFRAYWAEGRAMSLDQAISYALDEQN
jgi:hypothetical protein